MRKSDVTSKRESAKPSSAIVSNATESLEKSPAQHKKNVTNGADRHEMISMSAYYRSQNRDFNNGDEIHDWLDAEAEIDGLI